MKGVAVVIICGVPGCGQQWSDPDYDAIMKHYGKSHPEGGPAPRSQENLFKELLGLMIRIVSGGAQS